MSFTANDAMSIKYNFPKPLNVNGDSSVDETSVKAKCPSNPVVIQDYS